MSTCLKTLPEGASSWTDIEPRDATDIYLPWELAPLNEVGMRCPWPWDPQQLVGAPLGQYHCPYCMGMQMAGLMHMDWSDDEDTRREEGMNIATYLEAFWTNSLRDTP